VQFGYRFSNDFAPFALVLVTLAIAWRGPRPLVVGLVVLSVLVNAWGVYWGVTLGW
jgi:DNA mismatch repair protein MutH